LQAIRRSITGSSPIGREIPDLAPGRKEFAQGRRGNRSGERGLLQRSDRDLTDSLRRRTTLAVITDTFGAAATGCRREKPPARAVRHRAKPRAVRAPQALGCD